MKKTLFFVIIFFCTISNISAENIKRIVIGNADAKISIIAFESLTCSHCADFSKNGYKHLKEKYIDTGLVNLAQINNSQLITVISYNIIF